MVLDLAGAIMNSVRLLGDVQEHAHAKQGYEERRSSIRHQGQRYAFGRHEAQNYTHIDEGLKHHHAGDPDRQVASKNIFRLDRRS